MHIKVVLVGLIFFSKKHRMPKNHSCISKASPNQMSMDGGVHALTTPGDRKRCSHSKPVCSANSENVASNSNTPSFFLKARPMANRVGLSTKTLSRWADAGHIHRYKPNPRLTLYDPVNVENHIRSTNISKTK